MPQSMRRLRPAHREPAVGPVRGQYEQRPTSAATDSAASGQGARHRVRRAEGKIADPGTHIMTVSLNAISTLRSPAVSALRRARSAP
jgi:hypothetical protein